MTNFTSTVITYALNVLGHRRMTTVRIVVLLLAALPAGLTVMLGVALTDVALTPEAAAFSARPDIVSGQTIVTETSLCSPSQSGRMDVTVVSPGVQPQAGQPFNLLLTFVAVNACLQEQRAGLHVRLPAGIVLDNATPVCIKFNAANPGNVTTVSCRRRSSLNGYERIDPMNADFWSLTPGGLNTVQLQLTVRATSAGQKLFSGRVCDSGSDVICQGDSPPLANAIPFVEFNVGAAPTIELERLATLPSTTTTSSIQVKARFSNSNPAGHWEIQSREPNRILFTMIAEKEWSGTGFFIFSGRVTGLAPGTTRHFRTCFTPAGGQRVCGESITLMTKFE